MQFLADMTYPGVKEAVVNPLTVVFLPVGTTEVHGPHLPIDTDCLGARELCIRAGEILEQGGYNVVIAPLLSYGVCKVTMPFPGSITLQPETLERVIADICMSLDTHGFRNLVLLNHHGEKAHVAALARAVDGLNGVIEAKVLFAGIEPSYHNKGAKLSLGGEEFMRGEHPELDWHAGEYETALVLFKRPGIVDEQLIRTLPPVNIDLHDHWEKGAKTFIDIPGGENCYFGDPSVATAQVGEKVFEARARLIAERLIAQLSVKG